MRNPDLKRRILDIAYRHKLSHLGSCVSCVDTIEAIYAQMDTPDIFILSNGHAGLAQYAVLEKHYGHDAERLYLKHGTHPHRDEANHIYCTTGSLGMGIAAAVGRALANPLRRVHVMLSDGECAEGVVWESLAYAEGASNLKAYVMCNGFGAYGEVSHVRLVDKLAGFSSGSNIETIVCGRWEAEDFPFLRGLGAHYYVMTEADHKIAMELTA